MRNMQRDKEMSYQKQRYKQKDNEDAIDFIGGLKLSHIGDNTIDLFNDAQLKGVQDELMGMMQKGAGVNEIKMAAIPKLQKIGQGYTIAKNEYNKISEAQKNLMRDYPEGNAEAARNVMGKGLLENVLEFNPDGSVKGYKDLSLINSNRNYSEDLFDPEKMDKWYPKTTDAVVSNIQKTRGLTPIEGQLKLINQKGGYIDKKYKGHISIYDRPKVNEEGKITGIDLDSETVSLGKNPDGTANVIQVMPKDKYDVFRGDGKSAMQFDKAVYDHISEDLGINPKSLDPQALDIYSRNYALNFLDRTKLHGSSYNQFDTEKQDPIRNTTNITNKFGNDVKTMDIVTPVRDYFENVGEQKEGLKGIAQINLFNNEVTTPVIEEVRKRYPDATADNIYYAKNGDDIWVMRATTTGDNGKIKIDRKNDTPVFKLDEFSNISGNKPQGQKAKNKSLAEAQNKMDSKQGITYSWNGYDYSEDEINQAAAAEKLSKDAYLKKHGIKKK